jgi:nitroimidazol reductase NimA-like FMN-containing flavoprotein (pyridoxamine 5'-phosphate oxidase superfamily)
MPSEPAAADILKKIIYATVATASPTAAPWNTPVYVVYDEQLNFYWASGKQSQHSRNIAENPRVFIAIYDSTVPWGTGQGVFIAGNAMEVADTAEIAKACQLRMQRTPDAKHPPEEFTHDKPRSIYKLVPSKVWMIQDAKVNGYFVDERAELNINTLCSLITIGNGATTLYSSS